MLELLATVKLRGLIAELKARGDFRRDGLFALKRKFSYLTGIAAVLVVIAILIPDETESWIGAATALGFLCMTPWQLRVVAKQQIIPYTFGIPAKACITEVKRGSPHFPLAKSFMLWTVHYEFRDQAGNAHEGLAFPVPRTFARRMQEAPEAFHVLYEPADPANSHQLLVEPWFRRGCMSRKQFHRILPTLEAEHMLTT